MGNLFSTICNRPSTIKRQVLVVKEDGALLKFKAGIRAKVILEAYPNHKLIRCCPDTTLLQESFQLSCNQLFFLLPRGLALHDDSYDRLLRLASSRNPKSSILCSGRNDGNWLKETTNKTSLVVEVEGNKNIKTSDYDDSRCHKSRWKPALQTIPEIKSSPALHFSLD